MRSLLDEARAPLTTPRSATQTVAYPAPHREPLTSLTVAQIAVELMASIAHDRRSKNHAIPPEQRTQKYWNTLFKQCLMTVSDPLLYQHHLRQQEKNSRALFIAKKERKVVHALERQLDQNEQKIQIQQHPLIQTTVSDSLPHPINSSRRIAS
jgi:hypothetical protein